MSNTEKLSAQEIVRQANIMYFRSQAYEKTHWMGIKTAKCPMDMWVYQEIIHEIKPDLLIETGTLFGGSALYFASLMDQLNNGRVLTIDIAPQDNLPEHPRIDYLVGSSLDADILNKVEEACAQAKTVMVILDSDHKADYKLKEMLAYTQFVTSGSYLIPEDTCFDAFPAWPEYGPGPFAALNAFLKQNADYDIDRSREMHMISFAPMAFLKKR